MRWTVVEEFERDGIRYRVARQEPVPARSSNKLSRREAEVVSWAARGHANKVIAYELGISHATVRVLMHRAATKLGAGTRRALLEVFQS